MNQKVTYILVGLVALVLIVLSQSVFTVHQTKQVLVLRFGEHLKTHSEPGLKLRIPLVDEIYPYEKRVLNLDPRPEEIILRDQRRLMVDTFVRYRILDPLLFYQTVTTERVAAQRLQDFNRAAMRDILGKTDLEIILTGGKDMESDEGDTPADQENRASLMEDIKKRVNSKALELGLEIVDVRIRRADLPEAISDDVYKRMRSEREREARETRAKGAEQAQIIRAGADRQKVEIVAEAAKKAQTLRGQGDETAITIYANAFNQEPDFYAFYRSLEAYRISLSSDETTFVLSPDSDFFRYFENLKGIK